MRWPFCEATDEPASVDSPHPHPHENNRSSVSQLRKCIFFYDVFFFFFAGLATGEPIPVLFPFLRSDTILNNFAAFLCGKTP